MRLSNALQMEIKLSVAVLVGRMRVALDAAKMDATTPAGLIDIVRQRITLVPNGGVHLRFAPRS